MRRIVTVLCAMGLACAVGAGAAQAQTAPRWFESMDEARQRHSAERWNQYERHGYQPPLGGYSGRLGDPAPYGTERPGYGSPQPYNGYGSRNSGNSFGGNAWGNSGRSRY